MNNIKKFIANSDSIAIKRNTVNSHLVQEFENFSKVVISTIGNYMKRYCSLSYKQLEGRYAYSISPDNSRKFLESAAIQQKFLNKGVELIFLDEFSLNTRHMRYRGWTIKGHKGYTKIDSSGFSMSFIVALSSKRIYGIMGWSEAIGHSVVRYFITCLLCLRNKSPSTLETPFALIVDNSSVHVWEKMAKFYERSKVCSISITLYRPSLNISEKLIWSIKRHLNCIGESGR